MTTDRSSTKHSGGPARPRTRPAAQLPALVLLPGLVIACGGYLVAAGLHHVVPAVAPVTWAVLLGIIYANVPGLSRPGLRPGLTFAAKRLLRVGVAILGLSVSVGAILSLGLPVLTLVVGTLLLTFFATRAVGRWWGLNKAQSLLLATGFAICGASAIAAMRPNTDADDEDAAVAVALVTLCGTAAMLTLPLLQGPLGLTDTQMGVWLGASIHDVGQVVGAASAVGATALTIAVIVKLARVLMLSPMVSGVALSRRIRRSDSDGSELPPIMPVFVAVFLILVAVRSFGLVTPNVIDITGQVQGVVFGVAVFGLGAGVHVPSLLRRGHVELSLAAVATLFIVALSLGGTHVLID